MRALRSRAAKVFLLGLGLLAGWVASAGAELPPLPPPPTIQVPTLPVLPPAPPVPHPPPAPQPPPAPIQVPPAPVPKVALPPAPVAAPPAIVPPLAQSRPTSSGGSGAAARPSYRDTTQVTRLRLARDWIARRGSKRQQRTVLVFTLPKAALVEFVVVQISPRCRRVGRFRVRGRRGVNRVPFQGRVGGRALSPGTYRIQAKAGQHRVVDARLVVVSRRDPGKIASARSADACTPAATSVTSAGARTSASGPAGTAEALPKGAATDHRPSKGSLGEQFTREAVDAVASIPPWVYALLGVAIALLAVAALPLRATPSAETAMFLAHRRGVIAAAGAAALAVATIAYALH